ncbi:MAG: hypothetical protein OXR73_05715 [Myxococcales bacterium]|nr:hypothetical protein [Myxococcales bacterium]
MLQRDYLLRMIEQAMRAVVRALRLVEERKPEEAQDAIDQAYSVLGFDREIIEVLAPGSAVTLIDVDKRVPARLLFLCEAELALAQGKRVRARRKAALAEHLHASLEAAGDEQTDVAQRLRALKARIAL